jgi:transcription factor E2F3
LFNGSQFDEKFEELGGVETPARHANMSRHHTVEDFNTTDAGQCSTSMDVVHNVQQNQRTPQDPNASHDFGGMTRIIPSDVDVSQIVLTYIF